MISQTAEYALRAIVYLAINSGKAFTTQQIAATTKVPTAYLSKVLLSLVRARLVQSQRGWGGGFVLSRPALDISILDVLNAVDPIRRIYACPLGLESHGTNLCALHKKLDDAGAIIENVFAGTTIAELLRHPTSSIPLYDGTSAQHNGGCACGQ